MRSKWSSPAYVSLSRPTPRTLTTAPKRRGYSRTVPSRIEARLVELGLELPPPLPPPRSRMRRTAQAGNLVYLSGNGPFRGGDLVYAGKVGADLTLQEAREAATPTALNMVRV